MQQQLIHLENDLRVYFAGIIERAQEGEIETEVIYNNTFIDRFQPYCNADELSEELLEGVMNLVRKLMEPGLNHEGQ